MSALDGKGTKFPSGINVDEGELFINSVAVTSTAAELNKLDGVTASTAEINKLDGLTEGKTIAGSRFFANLPIFAAADIGKVFFIAPAACKIISITERHSTVAGQPGTMKIEKLVSGDDPGNGNVVHTTAFNLASAAYTPVTVTDINATYQALAAGDALATLVSSGAATSYAGGSLTVLLEWT